MAISLSILFRAISKAIPGNDGKCSRTRRYHFDVHLLLANTMRTKVRKAPELGVIRGVPMKKQRLNRDIAEIELYFQMLTENVSGVSVALVFNLS
jgi:hypothetical protein